MTTRSTGPFAREPVRIARQRALVTLCENTTYDVPGAATTELIAALASLAEISMSMARSFTPAPASDTTTVPAVGPAGVLHVLRPSANTTESAPADRLMAASVR